MHDCSGRTALVTGASSGLGEGFARALASAGARLVIGARRLDRLDALAREISGSGGQVLPVQLDVTDEASVIAAYDAAQDRFGTIDTVVCNAGFGHGDRSTDAQLSNLRTTMETNLLGVYLTAREGARRMIASGFRESERGRIVIIGSITAEQHHTGDSMYAGTKAALAHLGRNFAKEWARQGINVNVIQPGWVESEINAEWRETEESKQMIQDLPRRRMIPQDALHDPLLYLCSDASLHVTGANLTIDDGMSL